MRVARLVKLPCKVNGWKPRRTAHFALAETVAKQIVIAEESLRALPHSAQFFAGNLKKKTKLQAKLQPETIKKKSATEQKNNQPHGEHDNGAGT